MLTNDGSYTLYNAAIGEHYHSVKGAVAESQHVFINAGLKFIGAQNNAVHILEVGLGTGLNALLTLQYAFEYTLRVHYTAVELFPLDLATVISLNLPEAIHHPELEHDFIRLHQTKFDKEFVVNDRFAFIKHRIDIRKYENTQGFNLVYYDAFSPNVQPELWTKELLETIYSMMLDNAALVTYCAKGQVKRDLKNADFLVQTLQGALGKREMIRAVKMSIA